MQFLIRDNLLDPEAWQAEAGAQNINPVHMSLPHMLLEMPVM